MNEKKLVSDIIFKVLTGNICVREALKLFPPDSEDPSVKCACHALIHYETDEEYRKKDSEYAQEQDDYLEMIAFTLRDGNDLPKNIIDSYDKYYETAFIPRSNHLKTFLKSLFRSTL